MLAFWFMDDGYTRIRAGGRRPLAEIATNAFSAADLQLSDRRVSRRLGLTVDKGVPFAPATSTFLRSRSSLSALIAPFAPPVDALQAPPRGRSRRFRSIRLALQPGVRPEVLYDDVEVEDVTASASELTRRSFASTSRARTTSSQLVVSCTTAGPPGNRDPAAGRDRELPGLPAAAGRADPADGDLHARQLLDQAAARRPDRDHAPARTARGAHARHGARCACTRSSIRPRRCTRRACSRRCARTSRGCRELLALGRARAAAADRRSRRPLDAAERCRCRRAAARAAADAPAQAGASSRSEADQLGLF